jgi:hypothetical protein
VPVQRRLASLRGSAVPHPSAGRSCARRHILRAVSLWRAGWTGSSAPSWTGPAPGWTCRRCGPRSASGGAPEGTGQPSPKLFADRKPKRLQAYQERIGAGLVPMGPGVLAGTRLMSPAWRERMRVRAAYDRATSVPGSKVSSVSGAWAGLRRCHVDLFRRSVRPPWVNSLPSAWPRGPRAWHTVTPSGGTDGG